MLRQDKQPVSDRSPCCIVITTNISRRLKFQHHHKSQVKFSFKTSKTMREILAFWDQQHRCCFCQPEKQCRSWSGSKVVLQIEILFRPLWLDNIFAMCSPRHFCIFCATSIDAQESRSNIFAHFRFTQPATSDAMYDWICKSRSGDLVKDTFAICSARLLHTNSILKSTKRKYIQV